MKQNHFTFLNLISIPTEVIQEGCFYFNKDEIIEVSESFINS